MDGGLFLAPPLVLLFGLLIFATALPFTLGALGVAVGDLGRRLALKRLGDRTGPVLSAVAGGLLLSAMVSIAFSDHSVMGSVVLAVACAPILLGFTAAAWTSRSKVRYAALAGGAVIGLIVVVHLVLRYDVESIPDPVWTSLKAAASTLDQLLGLNS